MTTETKDRDLLQQGCDRLAIALAGACGVHCLLTPVLLIAFPLLAGTFLVEESFHYWILAATVPATSLATFIGCRKHQDSYVLIFAVTGLAVLIAAVVIGHNFWGEGGERAMTVAGGAILVTAHVRNFRLCRPRDSSCHSE